MPVTEKTIKTMLESLSGSFDEDIKKTKLFEFIEENATYLADPVEAHIMIMKPFLRSIELFVSASGTCDHFMQSVHAQYGFYETNLTGFIEKAEGSCCCADKARHIIYSYLKYKKTEEKIIFDHDKYFAPDKGEAKDWFAFVEGLCFLLSGRNEKYLTALKCLIEIHTQET